VIEHEGVSRQHAVVYGGPHCEVEDLGSSNGTRLDGQLLEPGKRVALRLGAALQIGPATLVAHPSDPAIDPGQASAVGTPHEARFSLPPRDGLVLRDERMLRLYQGAYAIAAGDISVLILGETGVGKELLAQAIHAMSRRRAHAFVKFNSAALPEQLVESELFGYERGAFTSADKAKAGLFETADQGTLFLDEVGDLSMTAQAKLLRVLESGEIQRVGSLKPRQVSVRFISATNRDLRALIAAGTFRKDLFYRLNGVPLRIPALRDRPLDIAPLVEYFAARAITQPGVAPPTFTEAALAKLVRHHWPGNVRELRNVVERAALLARGPIQPDQLQLEDERGSLRAAPPARSATPVSESSTISSESETRIMHLGEGGELLNKLRKEIAETERKRIVEALSRAHGNQTVAAKLLGVSRPTLLSWLDRHSIPRPRKGPSHSK
jgi:transcriptional regulator with GAF, ATPase, and Fis domain